MAHRNAGGTGGRSNQVVKKLQGSSAGVRAGPWTSGEPVTARQKSNTRGERSSRGRHRHVQAHAKRRLSIRSQRMMRTWSCFTLPTLSCALAYDMAEGSGDLRGPAVIHHIRSHLRDASYELLIKGVIMYELRSNNLGHHFTDCRQKLRLLISTARCNYWIKLQIQFI